MDIEMKRAELVDQVIEGLCDWMSHYDLDLGIEMHERFKSALISGDQCEGWVAESNVRRVNVATPRARDRIWFVVHGHLGRSDLATNELNELVAEYVGNLWPWPE